MPSHNTRHITETEITQALVDENELPRSVREHLLTCPECRTRKERLEKNLAQLGELARGYAPQPERRNRLSGGGVYRAGGWFLTWKAAFGAAAMAAVVIGVVWSSSVFRTAPDVGMMGSNQELLHSEPLMNDVSILVENALPPIYTFIGGEAGAGFDEDFMKFVVPPVDDDSLSDVSATKGTTLC